MYVLAADNQWINNFHNMPAMPPPPPSSLTVGLLFSHGLAAALGSQFADCSLLPFWLAWALPLTARDFKRLARLSTQVSKGLLPHTGVLEVL